MATTTGTSSSLLRSTSPEIIAAVGTGVGMVAGSLLTRWLSSRSKLASRSTYTPGDLPKLPPKFGTKIHEFDPTQLKSCYNLIISSVTPRPIALVSTRSKEGVCNVAPYSYFGAMAHDPPTLAVGFCYKACQRKDSLQNVLDTKQCCINIISSWYLDAANHSCGNFETSIDEFVTSGMTAVSGTMVAAPRVAQAAVSYECVLEHVHPVKNTKGDVTAEVCIFQVVRIHVDDTVLQPGCDMDKPVVDTERLDPMGRLGGNTYTTIGEQVDIARPKV